MGDTFEYVVDDFYNQNLFDFTTNGPAPTNIILPTLACNDEPYGPCTGVYLATSSQTVINFFGDPVTYDRVQFVYAC